MLTAISCRFTAADAAHADLPASAAFATTTRPNCDAFVIRRRWINDVPGGGVQGRFTLDAGKPLSRGGGENASQLGAAGQREMPLRRSTGRIASRGCVVVSSVDCAMCAVRRSPRGRLPDATTPIRQDHRHPRAGLGGAGHHPGAVRRRSRRVPAELQPRRSRRPPAVLRRDPGGRIRDRASHRSAARPAGAEASHRRVRRRSRDPRRGSFVRARPRPSARRLAACRAAASRGVHRAQAGHRPSRRRRQDPARGRDLRRELRGHAGEGRRRGLGPQGRQHPRRGASHLAAHGQGPPGPRAGAGARRGLGGGVVRPASAGRAPAARSDRRPGEPRDEAREAFRGGTAGRDRRAVRRGHGGARRPRRRSFRPKTSRASRAASCGHAAARASP